MKTLIVYSLVVLTALFLSCKKQKQCSAFNEADLKYIPYSAGDTLIFKNQQNEFFKIYLEKFEKSASYSFKCVDLYDVCPCLNNVDIIATDSRNHQPYTFLKMEQGDVSNAQYFKYTVFGFYFEFDFRNELPYIDQIDYMELKDTLTIGNKKYSEVIIINNIDNAATSVSKVCFNEEDGILKVVESTIGKEWSRVD